MTDGGFPPRIRAEFVLAAALFAAAGILRLNDLHLYTPDSARYLILAGSIARGEGWLDDTQPEPLRHVIHAPLYPALIAPAAGLFPMEAVPAKALTLLFGLVALVILYLWLYTLFGRLPAAAGAFIFALNPIVLVHSTEILSEAPFTASLLLILYLLDRAGRFPGLNPPGWWALIAAASLIGLLREAGVAVTLVAAVRAWSIDRRRAAAIAVCALVALGAWHLRNSVIVGAPPGSPGGNASLLLRAVLTPPEAGLAAEIAARVAANGGHYLPYLAGLGFFPLHGPAHPLLLEYPAELLGNAAWAVAAGFGAIMVLGLARTVRASSGGWWVAASAAGIAAAALVYPVRDERFLTPLVPVMIYYLIAGLRTGHSPTGSYAGWRAGLIFGSALLIAAPNLPVVRDLLSLNVKYTTAPATLGAGLSGRDLYPEYYLKPWGDLGKRIADLPPDAVLATPAKELAVVSGGRKVLELDPGIPQIVFERLIVRNGVGWLLAPVRWGEMRVYEPLMSRSRRLYFQEEFRTGNLHLLRVFHRPFTEGSAGDDARPEPAGGLTEPGAAGLVRNARRLVELGRYGDALPLLGRALDAWPRRPEPLYENVVAASLSDDSVGAHGAFRNLAELRQAASFVVPARTHLSLAAEFREIRSLPPGAERSMRMLDLSRRYWEMGFYRRAAAILRPAAEEDTAFFVGHLWDFHFAFQTGDLRRARTALVRLDAIDSSNVLVRRFHSLVRLQSLLGKEHSRRGRCDLRLRMAGEYRDAELFDEAYDEGFAAAADDTSSSDARRFLASLSAQLGDHTLSVRLHRAYLALEPSDAAARALADSLERSRPR